MKIQETCTKAEPKFKNDQDFLRSLELGKGCMAAPYVYIKVSLSKVLYFSRTSELIGINDIAQFSDTQLTNSWQLLPDLTLITGTPVAL